jgi:hypothetical protein
MLVVAATALAVTPKKGAKFSGTAKGTVTLATSFTAKDPLSFKISSNGKALDGFTFKDTICDFAKSGQAPVGTIKVSGGKFSVSNLKTKQVAPSLGGGGKAYWIVTVSGKFTSPTKASGKLTYTEKGTKPAGSSCGPIKLSFTATG